MTPGRAVLMINGLEVRTEAREWILTWGTCSTSLAGSAERSKDAVSLHTQISKLLKDGKLPADAAENILALSGQLSDAQVNLAHLETEIMKMQRAHDALDEIRQRKGHYVLAETPTGARIYRLKEDAGTGEMPHEVCPDCFEQDQIRILQPQGSFLFCVSCKTNYQIKDIPSPRVLGGFSR